MGSRSGKKKRTAKAANSPEAKESELKGGGMKLARENPGRKQIRHPGKSEDKRKKMIEEENLKIGHLYLDLKNFSTFYSTPLNK